MSEQRDYRMHARVPVDAKAFLSSKGGMQVASVVDLSIGGIHVRTNKVIPIGAQVEVLVSMLEMKASFYGEVIRHTSRGVVVKMNGQPYPNPLSKLLLAL